MCTGRRCLWPSATAPASAHAKNAALNARIRVIMGCTSGCDNGLAPARTTFKAISSSRAAPRSGLGCSDALSASLSRLRGSAAAGFLMQVWAKQTVGPGACQAREYLTASAASTRFTSPSPTRMGRISSILRCASFEVSASFHITSGLPASSSALRTASLSCPVTKVAVGFDTVVGGREVLPAEPGLLIGRLEGDASPAVLGEADRCGGCCALDWELAADAWGAAAVAVSAVAPSDSSGNSSRCWTMFSSAVSTVYAPRASMHSLPEIS